MVVLWVVAALSILVMGLSQTSRVNTQATQFQRAETEARAFLDAGFVLGAARVAFLGAPSTRHVEIIDLGTARVTVRIFPGTGFIDLNHAPRDILIGLFVLGGGLDDAQAELLAEAVLEHRAGSGPGRSGAMEAYRGPFRVIEDLALVPGITGELRDKISNLVTVYSRNAEVDPHAAPHEVLLVISGDDAALMENDMQVSDNPLAGGAALDRRPGGLVRGASGAGSNAFRVDVQLAWKGRVWSQSRWMQRDFESGGELDVSALRTDPVASRPERNTD